MPVCKDCGIELISKETLWVEVDDGGSHVDIHMLGECTHCHQEYVWTEVFKYKDYKNLEKHVDN
jgi:hypothetical protein